MDGKQSRNSNYKVILLFVILICFVVGGVIFLNPKSRNTKINNTVVISSYVGKSIEELEEFALDNDLKLNKEYQYSSSILENVIISQDIDEGTEIEKGDTVHVVISKGEVPIAVYEENHVNELGNVPIMMYHGIHDMRSDETQYTGGNVDKDGYNRTAEAFRGDLEFYYQNNYRMIRLQDYIDGKIDVSLGKSPIILTFDDGKENNFKVIGEENGELVIDPNCAVGILEEYKKKYPDYHVTATFFINSGIFQQEEYNEKIVNWLIKHGYDVGNHTLTHPDFTKISESVALKEVGGMYQILNKLIPGKYVSIIAMPFGSPYKNTHPNFKIMLGGTYEGMTYQTKATLRVGWEAEVSPFDKEFNPLFLKRIRAYDNEGNDFDIKMNFKLLEKNRYVSDGDSDVIVVRTVDKDKVNSHIKIRTY